MTTVGKVPPFGTTHFHTITHMHMYNIAQHCVWDTSLFWHSNAGESGKSEAGIISLQCALGQQGRTCSFHEVHR